MNQPTLVISASRRTSRFETHVSEVRDWCRGKSPWPRAVLLAWFCWMGIQYLGDPGHVSLVYWLNFGIHEIGHVLTRPLVPHFVYVAAGTIVEFAVPIGAIFMFRRQHDLFAAYPVCSVWIATNLYYTSWYVDDARLQANPTAPIFGEPTTSDWTYLLGELGILHLDHTIADILEVAAFGFMWGGIALGCAMVAGMFSSRA